MDKLWTLWMYIYPMGQWPAEKEINARHLCCLGIRYTLQRIVISEYFLWNLEACNALPKCFKYNCCNDYRNHVVKVDMPIPALPAKIYVTTNNDSLISDLFLWNLKIALTCSGKYNCCYENGRGSLRQIWPYQHNQCIR